MQPYQPDLLAEDTAERNRLSAPARAVIIERLEATLARLGAETRFPWADAIEAALEENRFESGTQSLGDEGAAYWARFDKEMDRLYATQS